ncbi:GH25 family lysozyme [Alkalinema sp. FACHB-956]|uniref:GH25 family lysozyme n=1 Tax=Alkalinema sp. FACHB-956 TaxID=2692768 RepID=UPI0016839CF6|nr:GH25 family lysozyme [Alkalinema sp. FACHB-956]MBD2326634.1 peptidoglycan-binding protein [Alkalinema sp. FACHB-956]
MVLQGIDISEYQEIINWSAVSATNTVFGVAKATEGVQSRDPMFLRNWAGMKSAGLMRSAYHFFVANKDPLLQAKNFLGLTQAVWEDSDLPPVLDLEKSYGLDPNTVLDRAGQWLDAVEAALGRQPILYTFPSFWHDALGNSPRLAHYKLWIAHYETNNPWVPGGWKTWTFHQYTESGAVSGIAGPVDRNTFNGDLDSLARLLKDKPPLRQGYEGQVVLELQKLLKGKGLDVGNPDGDFGLKTKNAVRTFQSAQKLAVDGIVGSKTWNALLSSSGMTTPRPPSNSTLVDVCRSYKALAHQDQALQWLQSNIAKPILDQFTLQWRQTQSVSTSPLSFINVCKSYKALPHQIQALQQLQQKLPQATLSQFLQIWRN